MKVSQTLSASRAYARLVALSTARHTTAQQRVEMQHLARYLTDMALASQSEERAA